jgi:hypothetical protein
MTYPRVSAGLRPREVRDKYLGADPEFTKVKLLDTQIWLYEQDEKRLAKKVRRIRLAILFLAVAILFSLVGSIVHYSS